MSGNRRSGKPASSKAHGLGHEHGGRDVLDARGPAANCSIDRLGGWVLPAQEVLVVARQATRLLLRR